MRLGGPSIRSVTPGPTTTQPPRPRAWMRPFDAERRQGAAERVAGHAEAGAELAFRRQATPRQEPAGEDVGLDPPKHLDGRQVLRRGRPGGRCQAARPCLDAGSSLVHARPHEARRAREVMTRPRDRRSSPPRALDTTRPHCMTWLRAVPASSRPSREGRRRLRRRSVPRPDLPGPAGAAGPGRGAARRPPGHRAGWHGERGVRPRAPGARGRRLCADRA